MKLNDVNLQIKCKSYEIGKKLYTCLYKQGYRWLSMRGDFFLLENQFPVYLCIRENGKKITYCHGKYCDKIITAEEYFIKGGKEKYDLE